MFSREINWDACEESCRYDYIFATLKKADFATHFIEHE